jgi:hypothetical protein
MAVNGQIYLDLVRETGFTEEQMDDEFKYFALNLILYNVIKLNYTAFLQKAVVPAYRKLKGVDQYGISWDPLSSRTIAIKKRLNYRYAGVIAINIRTRRLLEALKPGYFRNGYYVPRAEQVVRITLDNIFFAVNVPYAGYVDAKRPIFIQDSRLIRDAVKKSLPILRNYWKRRDVLRKMNRAKRRLQMIEKARSKLRPNPPAPQ